MRSVFLLSRSPQPLKDQAGVVPSRSVQTSTPCLHFSQETCREKLGPIQQEHQQRKFFVSFDSLRLI